MTKTKHHTFHQGDINLTPLEAFGKSAKDVSRKSKLRSTANRVLIQEGEITGHHHGIWGNVAMLHDGALARSEADVSPININAQLFRDDVLTRALKLDEGAPVIGFLVAETNVIISHASADGRPTGEHADIQLPSGGYLVTGKREWTAGDERRVQD